MIYKSTRTGDRNQFGTTNVRLSRRCQATYDHFAHVLISRAGPVTVTRHRADRAFRKKGNPHLMHYHPVWRWRVKCGTVMLTWDRRRK